MVGSGACRTCDSRQIAFGSWFDEERRPGQERQQEDNEEHPQRPAHGFADASVRKDNEALTLPAPPETLRRRVGE